MKASELDYELPPELIAQHPAERRDESRLLVYDRASGEVRHRRFRDLPDELRAATLVVVNDTRVVPARIRDRAAARARCCCSSGSTATCGRGSRGRRGGCAPGRRYGPVELLEHLGEGRWRLRLDGEPAGETPLPPYITEPLDDPARYQTVYARERGSAAAPTAGLHFTPELLARLDVERVTLHVGLDTFRPLAVDASRSTRIHGERYEVEPAAWERIRARRARARRRHDDRPHARDARPRRPLAGRTDLFVTPGFEFRRVDRAADELPPAALDAARARDGVRGRRGDARLYRLAVEERYRFYSFGDAMLIL